jgi:hypothetical protein
MVQKPGSIVEVRVFLVLVLMVYWMVMKHVSIVEEMPPLTIEAFDKAALLIQEDIRGAVRYFCDPEAY